MWIALEATLESPPEVYQNWAGVLRWCELTFGGEAEVKETEVWPMEFVPNWFHPDMLPHKVDVFTPVVDGDVLVGLVFEVNAGYPRQYGAARVNARDAENTNAQLYWHRRSKEWVRWDNKPPVTEG